MSAQAQILSMPFSSRPTEHVHDGGYVKSYRRMFTDGDSVLKHDRRLIGAWMEMYHTAAWKPVDVQFGESWIRLAVGQLVINYREWAKRWFLPVATFYRACQRMEKEGRIRIEVKRVRNGVETRIALVTVVNLGLYQGGETGSEQGRNTHARDIENAHVSNEVKEGKVVPESRTNTESPDLKPNRTQTVVRPDGLSADADGEFETWWSEWGAIPGGKRSKGVAKRAWKTARKKTDAATLIRRVRIYVGTCKADGKEIQFIKHPSSWLNGECWEDDLKRAPERRCLGLGF